MESLKIQISICVFLICLQLGHAGDLPQALIQDYENNEDFLKKVHHVLLEVM